MICWRLAPAPLVYAALLGVGIERGFGNAVFQNLCGFEDAVVLLEKQIEPLIGCYAAKLFCEYYIWD